MESKEFVSVVIPNYNNGQYIRDAIISAVDRPEVSEVIVIDDFSSDNSMEVISTLKHTKLKVYLLPSNMGVSYARNFGVNKASSNFIAFLDSDDYFLDNRFDDEYAVFSNDSTIDAIYHCTGSDEEDGKLIDRNLQTMKKKIAPKQLHKALLGTIKREGFFSIDSVTFRKKIFENNSFDTAIKVGEDTHFFIDTSINYNYQAGDLSNPRSRYRRHTSNSTESFSHYFHSDRAFFFNKLFKKYNKSDLLGRREKNIILAYWAYNSLADKNFYLKIREYFKFIIKYPRLFILKRFQYYVLLNILSLLPFLGITSKRP